MNLKHHHIGNFTFWTRPLVSRNAGPDDVLLEHERPRKKIKLLITDVMMFTVYFISTVSKGMY